MGNLSQLVVQSSTDEGCIESLGVGRDKGDTDGTESSGSRKRT